MSSHANPEQATDTQSTTPRRPPGDQIILPVTEPPERDPDRIRWGTVTTVKADLPQIARFTAWHLELGAARVVLYLDAPDEFPEGALRHPRLQVVRCDDAYWEGRSRRARETHQMRQAFNASHAYRRARKLHWLAHIDIDEFLLPQTGTMAGALAQAPADAAGLRLRPAELLSGSGWPERAAFKLTRASACRKNRDIAELYPVFGPHLRDGFLSYTGGKTVTRTGLGKVRIGIHSILKDRAKVANTPFSDAVLVGHAHAPDWDHFQRHLRFRRDKGSYRRQAGKTLGVHDILDTLDNESELRGFFEEVQTASPRLMAGLRGKGMLVEREMRLPALVRKWFPGQEGLE